MTNVKIYSIKYIKNSSLNPNQDVHAGQHSDEPVHSDTEFLDWGLTAQSRCSL